MHQTLFIKFRRWIHCRLYVIFIAFTLFSLALIIMKISINNETPVSIRRNEILMDSRLENFSNEYYSPLSPGIQWCSSNPFLIDFDRKNVMDLERKWIKWSKNQFLITYSILFNYAQLPNERQDLIVKLAYPTSSPLSCPKLSDLKWYGTSDETGKALCAVDKLKNIDDCVIYSLGSNNQFAFENDILAQTPCKVYVYDCTSLPPIEPMKRLSFHKICLGRKQNLQNHIYPMSRSYDYPQKIIDSLTYKTYQKIITENNHKEVHILKMDIEGGEYSVFADMFKHANQAPLPYQISFESHWWNKDIYHATLHQQMFLHLWKYGYRFVHHEVNPMHKACIEWTLLRVFC